MAEEKPFRILLDLSQLGSNYSRYVWMNISPRELTTVFDLKNAVARKLNCDKKCLKFYVHDGLLPEEERIIILRDNDTVKVHNDDLSRSIHSNSNASVFFASHTSDNNCTCVNEERCNAKKRKRKSETIENGSSEENSSETTSEKKRKKNILIENPNILLAEESESENGSKKKKKRKSRLTEEHEQEKMSPIVSENIENPDSRELLTKYSEISSPAKFSNVFPSEQKCEVPDETSPNIPNSACESSPAKENPGETVVLAKSCKKKRKRSRKRKSIPSTIDFLIPDTETENDCSQAAESAFLPHNKTVPSTTDNFSCVRKHIQFDTVKPADSSHDYDVVDLDSYLAKFKSGSTVASLKRSEIASLPGSPVNKIQVSGQRSSTPTLRKIVKHTSWSVSPMRSKSSLQGSEQKEESYEQKQENDEEQEKTSIEEYPTLNTLPQLGARIAYKVLELDENYSPVVSAYKEGIVRKIESSTEEMEIELLQEEIKPGKYGKFENLSKDEEPETKVIKTVTIGWANLIEPRCISS